MIYAVRTRVPQRTELPTRQEDWTVDITLCVLSVDMQNPLCAFHTLTVVSEEADITRRHRGE